MQIILTEDVKKLGKSGDVVNVADGYARNFLFPKGLAEQATEESLKKVEKTRTEEREREEALLEEFKKTAEKISGKKITILEKAKDEKLFGSVDSAKIAKEINDQLDASISPEMIKTDSSIKEIGEKDIEIIFNDEIRTRLVVEIKAE